MDPTVQVALIGLIGTAITVLVPVLSGQKKIEKKLDAHITEDSMNMAETWRVRILKFDDDLCNKNIPYPSEAHFQQTMHACDKYEAFIKSHNDFHNGIGEQAITHIRSTFSLCRENQLFGMDKVGKVA